MFDERYFLKWGFQEDNIGTVVRLIHRFSKAKKCLIVPSGYGQVVGFCNSYFPGDFFGFDVSEFLVEKGRRMGVSVGDIRTLEESFIPSDLFVCCDLLEHFDDVDLDKSLQQIDLVTTEDSFFILRVLTDYDKKLFSDDETHITCRSDMWWKEKVEKETEFSLFSMSSLVGEMVFYKGSIEDEIEEKKVIDSDFFEYNERINIITRKNKEFFIYKRRDNRLAVEAITKDPFFRKHIVSFEITECSSFHLYYDDFGRIKILDDGGEILILNHEKVLF